MAEKLFNPEKVFYPFSINLNWYNSRSIVSAFARQSLSNLQDRSSNISPLVMEEFIFNLGHGRRSFSTFPLSFVLHVPESQTNITLNGKAFWAQLIDQLVEYFEQLDTQFKPTTLQANKPSIEYARHIEQLKRLMAAEDKTNFQIEFEKSSTLNSMTIVGIS